MLSLVCLTQEQNTVSVERQIAMAKTRISAPERANPIALFWCLASVLMKDCFGGGVRSLKFLDNVTRDVFVRTKFFDVLWKIKELICVISLRAWSTNEQSK